MGGREAGRTTLPTITREPPSPTRRCGLPTRVGIQEPRSTAVGMADGARLVRACGAGHVLAVRVRAGAAGGWAAGDDTGSATASQRSTACGCTIYATAPPWRGCTPGCLWCRCLAGWVTRSRPSRSMYTAIGYQKRLKIRYRSRWREMSLSLCDIAIAVSRPTTGSTVLARCVLGLNREGIAVDRCTVDRLMAELGLTGRRPGQGQARTTPGEMARCPSETITRDSAGMGPLGVAALGVRRCEAGLLESFDHGPGGPRPRQMIRATQTATAVRRYRYPARTPEACLTLPAVHHHRRIPVAAPQAARCHPRINHSRRNRRSHPPRRDELLLRGRRLRPVLPEVLLLLPLQRQAVHRRPRVGQTTGRESRDRVHRPGQRVRRGRRSRRRCRRSATSSGQIEIDALLRKWLAILPHPFTADDRAPATATNCRSCRPNSR